SKRRVESPTALRKRFPVTTRVRPAIVQHIPDLLANRLAAVVGSWPQAAILGSGRGFGEAGRWSLYAAHPRLVFEATGTRWSTTTDAGSVQSGEGDPLTALTRLVDRFHLADPADELGPDRAPFEGGLIGFFGY